MHHSEPVLRTACVVLGPIADASPLKALATATSCAELNSFVNAASRVEFRYLFSTVSCAESRSTATATSRAEPHAMGHFRDCIDMQAELSSQPHTCSLATDGAGSCAPRGTAATVATAATGGGCKVLAAATQATLDGTWRRKGGC